MQSELVPYQPGMTLGREYDLKSYSSGLDLFTEDSLSKVESIDSHKNRTHYSVIKKAQDVNNVLEVSGELSLKVKANLVKVEGAGKYLKEYTADENSLEILAMAKVETVTDTMKQTELRTGIPERLQATHFIRSITYGGELLVRIRIQNSDKKQLDEIKADLTANLSVNGVVDAGAKAKFKQLEKDLTSSSEMNISYFSTTPSSQVPRDIDGMVKVLDNFQHEVKKQNGGKGCPIRCELVPLTFISSKVPDMIKDQGLEVLLEQLETNFDDLLGARAKLDSFLGDSDIELTESQEEEGGDIDQRLKDVLRIYQKVVAELDLSKRGRGSEPIEQAFEVYGSKKKLGGFRKEVSMFISKVRKPKERSTPLADLPPGKPLDMILMGKANRGASTTGNTIFGQKKFSSQIPTETMSSPCLKISDSVGGRKLNVIDHGGVVDQTLTRNMMTILHQSGVWFPRGVHVILLVMSAIERLSKEEISAIESLRQSDQNILGKYVICVFTHGDSFLRQMELDGKSLTFSQYLTSVKGPMQRLLLDCHNRYILFNNAEADPGKKREMVIDLIRLIDSLIKDNGGEKLSLDPENERSTPLADLPPGKPLDMILMGKANRGASTTGNTIFGQKKFSSQIPTETMSSPCLKISDSVGGRKLNVIDHGGVVDQTLTRNMMTILHQSGVWFPRGVHVILLVMSAIERLSKEEISAIESLRQSDQNILGKYVVCVFTHGDSFLRQMELDGKSLTFSQYIESVKGPMQRLLLDCHNRYILFNNAEADPGKKREMVIDLIRLIDSLIKDNGGEKLSLDPENVSVMSQLYRLFTR